MIEFTSQEYGNIDEAGVAAFDYCRDKNHPVIVLIDGHRCKLYPSGRMVDLITGKVNDDIDW